MSGHDTQSWKWVWPELGPNPSNEDTHSEMFDRTDYPYSETFVREAIQNSLDARLDSSKPVIVKFAFHSDDVGPRGSFLKQVIDYRNAAGLKSPDEWGNGHVRWLTVEDFNSKGLSGSLEDRMSDFWNYWLNFGRSNKDGVGRGGRGIGRMTFIIASRLQSVIAYTRRAEDGKIAVCGMAALQVAKVEGKLHSTHAYLAREDSGNIYALHDSPEFHDRVKKAFAFAGYDEEFISGLALAVPYPHKELGVEGILAAAIENFAPAIMKGQLQLEASDHKLNRTLDASSIDEIAIDVARHFNNEAIKDRVAQYLELIRRAQAKEGKPERISLPNAIAKDFEPWREKDNIKNLRKKIEEGQGVALEVAFPLERYGKKVEVSLRAMLAPVPPGRKPIDRLFREGMSLPKVKAGAPGAIDLVALVDESELATYLNFCEGKAHLDLEESKTVSQKLRDQGFGGLYDGAQIKRLVKNLPTELRRLLTPDLTVPDARLFEKYFSKPTEKLEDGKEKPPPSPAPTPTAKIPPFDVEHLNDGLRIKANPKFEGWPVDVAITLAYADGSRNPFDSWSRYDFDLEDIHVDHANCASPLVKEGNKIMVQDCNLDTEIEVTGFDTNRELEVRTEP